MKIRSIKFIGIIFMVLSHPIGYRLWMYILTASPLAITNGEVTVEVTLQTSLGIFELFITGLTLLILGLILENKKK